jgi:acyl-coenzyme A thioesterase PaaI-like protein
MIRKLTNWLTSANGMRRIMNIYGPYLGAGVKVRYLAKDFREAEVTMKLRWYNRNYVGTHFGGSLFSMIDPFYMLLLMNTLGRDYVVWDASASIDFVRPGRGVVKARFTLTDAMLKYIHEATANGDKYLPSYEVNITDEDGELVARAIKTLYIRRKPPRK